MSRRLFTFFLIFGLNKMMIAYTKSKKSRKAPTKRSHTKTKRSKYHQGYNDRKDESIAMRIRKKRTTRQLKASANESYGRFGSKAKKSGKINRSMYDWGSSRGKTRRTARRTHRRSTKRSKKHMKSKYDMGSSRGVARRTTRRTQRRSKSKAKKSVKKAYDYGSTCGL
jgi:hypothetical protein